MKDEFVPKVRRQLLDSYDTSSDVETERVAYFEENKRRKKRPPKPPKDLEIFFEAPEPLPLSTEPPPQFCSRSEAICAELLRRFVPHFDLQPGATFQVPIGIDSKGNSQYADFLVDGVIFEYHPVRFYKSKRRCGDFIDQDEYRTYTKIFHALSQERREFFHDVMRDRLSANYFKKRRAVLDKNPLFRRTELIVATSPEEFYHKVITRFGRNYPRSIERFVALFAELQKTLPT